MINDLFKILRCGKEYWWRFIRKNTCH